ncbi:MAG: hypothetical protein U1D30_11345 [Planctomycetota bacterium]
MSIDLTGYLGRTDLSVDFWANESWEFDDYFNYTTVGISGNGVTFNNTSIEGDPDTDNWVHYSLDLDWLMAQSGLSSDPTIFIRFSRSPEYIESQEDYAPTTFHPRFGARGCWFPADPVFYHGRIL